MAHPILPLPKPSSRNLRARLQGLVKNPACQLGGLGNALWLPLSLECSVMITQKLTSSQPISYFLTANLGDYCLHHNQPSISSLKSTSTKVDTPSLMPKEDTPPRCQAPAEAPKLPKLLSMTRVTITTTCKSPTSKFYANLPLSPPYK
ncbi:unnamed protein product [Prunus armeniaca]